MPYSDSVGTPIVAAFMVWLIIEKGFRRVNLGRAVGIGILSHLILDLLTHAQDIVLWPGLTSPKLGLGLYAAAPFAAFIIEVQYGVLCWGIYRGSKSLLALIVAGNLANVSFFSSAIPGPEQYLAGRPLLVVTVVFIQIVLTLVLVGVFGRSTVSAPAVSRASPTSSGHARSSRAAE